MLDPKIKIFEEMLPNSELRDIRRSTNVNENYLLTVIDKRLLDLEDKVFNSKKKIKLTRAQQMLLLHSLGFLDIINDLKIPKTKQAGLLSALLNTSKDNIEGDLHTISYYDKSDVHKEVNYKVVIDLLNKCGLREKAQELESKRIKLKR